MEYLVLAKYPLFDSYRKILDAIDDKTVDKTLNELTVSIPDKKYEINIMRLRKQGDKKPSSIIIELSLPTNTKFTFFKANESWFQKTESYYYDKYERWTETTLNNIVL